MLSVISTLCCIFIAMLSVIMLNVIMLSVVASSLVDAWGLYYKNLYGFNYLSHRCSQIVSLSVTSTKVRYD
jgi:hypothetical protein